MMRLPPFSIPLHHKTHESIHGESGNLLCLRTLIKGDVEGALADSDVVVTNTYRTTWVDHAFMETEAGIGYVDGNGRIVIASSTQNIHYKRREVSRLLAIPEESIQMIQASTGGGFGGKLDMTVEGYIALAVYTPRDRCSYGSAGKRAFSPTPNDTPCISITPREPVRTVPSRE